MAFPRRPSAFLRYLVSALLLALTFYSLTGPNNLSSQIGPLLPTMSGRLKSILYEHPIDNLIKDAEREFAKKISRTATTLEAAAQAYRKRRGRHPPPGFDKWYEFANNNDAIIVEEFWDQIYHDLEPFWGVKPAQIRKDARNFEMRIEIRDHKASSRSDWFWTQIWLQTIQTIEHLLPDMDLALNAMDEPRVVVPWEDIRRYMRQAIERRVIVHPKVVVSEFTRFPPPGEEDPDEEEAPETTWEHERHYWLIARRGCAPSSPARRTQVVTDFDNAPSVTSGFHLKHMRHGYVANYTLSTDFCHQADLQALEGIFVEPLSVSTTKSLLPVFGGSKLAVNNDILLPAPMYLSEEDRFTGAEGASIPWASKEPTVIWRGTATGGFNRESNWRSFQRHRFVAMNNGSQLALAESSGASSPPPNFVLPPKQYCLAAQRNNSLAQWISSVTDVSFTDLMCSFDGFWPGCNYTNPYFAASEPVPMSEQFRHKYLPDIDGNSFSGRYLGFLRSTSLPIKATLWREWHDSRLVAWKHFVPMDSRFGDWYGILEYFLGNEAMGVKGRDDVAEKIAMAGREWAAKVLRREDMQVYILRLLLEYARVTDDRREVMGWVGDLGEAVDS